MASWLGRGVGLLAALALCAALLMTLDARRARHAAEPPHNGRLTVSGLGEPLSVLRDGRGVPHVDAASELDAYFGLGFVHAQDRLAQMIWLRRLAQGRLAEVLGPSALASDRRARVIGFQRLAEADLAVLAPAARGLLDAYAAGVNAHLGRIRAGAVPPPPELAAWGGEEAPWSAADSLALLVQYAWALGGSLDESALLSDLVEHFGGFDAEIFFPDGVGMEVLPGPGEGPFTAGLGGSAAPAPIRRAAGLLGASIGSSVVVVGGRHTRSGRPLLAADSHLAPTTPALLHQAHLRAPTLEVAGAAIPGVPVFWSGFNGAVAWASSHAGAVVSDLVVETLREGPPRYHDGSGWQPLEVSREEIAVRGGDPLEVEVRRTANGPLVNGLFDRDRAPLALRWTGGEANAGVTAFLALPRARGAAELVAALGRHHEPVLAVGYVDAAGAAGIQLAGAMPERRMPSGLLPVPGRSPDFQWRGRLAPAALPAQRIRDGIGFEVASDGIPGGEWRRSSIEWLWQGGERTARLEALLYRAIEVGDLDLRDLGDIQGDLRSEAAGSVVTLALEQLGDREGLGSQQRTIAAILEDWDRSAGPDSVGAAVYHVFLKRLVRALFEPRMGRGLLERYFALGRTQPARLVQRVLVAASEQDGSGWADPPAVQAAVERSLQGTWLELNVEIGANRDKWTWGRLHPLSFRPPWPRPVRGGVYGPFRYGGDDASVLLGEYRPLESFEVSAVASYRFLVDAGDPGEALTALAPGQSGHVGHENARDGLARWLRNRHSLLSLSWLAVEESAVARLVLEPAAAPSETP